MFSVERTFKGSTKKHSVYSLEKADELGIEYVPWRDVREPGQWALTDDEYVCEALGVYGPYKARKNGAPRYQIVLPFCRMFIETRKDLNFIDFYGKGDYNSSQPTSWDEKEASRPRAQRVLRVYANLMLVKGRASQKDLDALGRIYRPDQENPRATFMRLLKSKGAKAMVRKEMVSLLNDMNITPQSVVEDYKDTFEKASNARQFGVAKSVLDKFSEMLGMDERPSTTPNQLTAGDEDDMLAGFLETEQTQIVQDDSDLLIPGKEVFIDEEA